jgi:hypothetical protein
MGKEGRVECPNQFYKHGCAPGEDWPINNDIQVRMNFTAQASLSGRASPVKH